MHVTNLKIDHQVDWPLVATGYLLAVALLVARSIWFSGDIPLIADTDDAMRLVVVRDFLQGQNWFDHTQYRLNVPDGASIHWSRLIDLPIAGLALIFTPFVADPLIAAAFVWPLVLLAGLMAFSVMLTAELVGKEGILPALVLPVLSAVVLVEFAPGRVDHHSVQIVLSLLCVLATVKSWAHMRWAVVAGIASATALAIGTESTPTIVATITAFALMWVVYPVHASKLRAFGLSFGIASVFHLALAQPPSHWFAPVCDAISLTYIVAAIGVGGVLTALSFMPLHNWTQRIGVGVALGGALVVGLIVAFPQCLAGPYAGMDPWLAENWLGRIIEAKPIWHSLVALPAYTIGIAVPPLLAVLVIAVKVWKGSAHRRAEWLIMALFLVLGILVMILQVRGARLLAPLAVPAGALAIVAFRRRYLNNNSLPAMAGMVLSWLGFTGIAVSMIAGLLIPKANSQVLSASQGGSKFECLQSEAFADLAGLPPERIMAPVDLGAHILLYTDHSVVAAPYHRAQDGVFDTFKFFNADEAEARTIAERRQISLIITCPWLGEMTGFNNTANNSLIRFFENGQLPDWLEDVSLPGAVLKVYVLKY